jgi:hypothetical protein
MNATKSPRPILRSVFSRKLVAVVAIGVIAYVWRFRHVQPAFNDANYTAMCADLDRTAALPDGSPEQAVAYMYLGKHLETPIYGSLTGLDVCHWVRDPANPLRPLLRRHPQLKHDWDHRCEDGFSNADHYAGFIAGPVSSARTLFQESVPEAVDRLNALLARHAGTDPMSLDRDAQEALLHRALVEDPEGRTLVTELTDRRLIALQTSGYRRLAEVAGIPGLALRWVQYNAVALVFGFVLLRTMVRGLRAWGRDRAARQEHRRRLGLAIRPVIWQDERTVAVPCGWPKDHDPQTSGEFPRELAV